MFFFFILTLTLNVCFDVCNSTTWTYTRPAAAREVYIAALHIDAAKEAEHSCEVCASALGLLSLEVYIAARCINVAKHTRRRLERSTCEVCFLLVGLLSLSLLPT